MRAETRKSSTNIHSFSMNNTCFFSPCFTRTRPDQLQLHSHLCPKKIYIYIYIYVFMTFHMQHRCLHYIGSLKGLLTIWSIVLWADFISSQVEKQWQGGKKDLSKTRTIETHFYVWTSAFRFLPRHENTHLKQVFRMKWCLHVVWGRYFNQQRKIFFND